MEAPEYFQCSQFATDNKLNSSSDNDDAAAAAAEHFIVEELLDLSNDDVIIPDDATTFNASFNGNSAESSSAVTAIDSCNSSTFSGCEPNSFLDEISRRDFADGHFSSELCVPYDDLAELEWLSNFVEESFSSEDLQKLDLISGVKPKTDEVSDNREINTDQNRNAAFFKPDVVSVPAKARSKRSRAVQCNWNNSSLLAHSPSPTSSSSDNTDIVAAFGPPQPLPISMKKVAVKATVKNKKDCLGLEAAGGGGGGGGGGGMSPGEGRRCMHCATDKTPQWRTGPMGPKTLCNACGVRYKSGRLVPEYRPAASPTFVLTKHSNSHRKVLELRRQKEIVRAHHLQQQQQHQLLIDQNQDIMFDGSNGDDYLIHQHVGPDFRQLI